MDRITFHRLKQKLSKEYSYEFVRIIGRGTFGHVIEMKHSKTIERYTVKVVGSHETSEGEFHLWPLLKHPNILPLTELISIPDMNKNVFVTPNLPYDLYKLDKSQMLKSLPDAFCYVKIWIKDVLSGLEYMHEAQIAHLNLKPNNVLITPENRAIISDFSYICTTLNPIDDCGLPHCYRPPEACWTVDDVLIDPVSFDLWSVGILVVEIITQSSLLKLNPNPKNSYQNYLKIFEAVQEEEFQRIIVESLYNEKMSIEKVLSLRNFILSFLHIDPLKRMTTTEALNHQFLDGEFVNEIDKRWKSIASRQEIRHMMEEFQKHLSSKEFIEDKRMMSPIVLKSEDNKEFNSDEYISSTREITIKNIEVDEKAKTVRHFLNQNISTAHDSNSNEKLLAKGCKAIIQETNISPMSSKCSIFYVPENSQECDCNEVSKSDKKNIAHNMELPGKKVVLSTRYNFSRPGELISCLNKKQVSESEIIKSYGDSDKIAARSQESNEYYRMKKKSKEPLKYKLLQNQNEFAQNLGRSIFRQVRQDNGDKTLDDSKCSYDSFMKDFTSELSQVTEETEIDKLFLYLNASSRRHEVSNNGRCSQTSSVEIISKNAIKIIDETESVKFSPFLNTSSEDYGTFKGIGIIQSIEVEHIKERAVETTEQTETAKERAVETTEHTETAKSLFYPNTSSKKYEISDDDECLQTCFMENIPTKAVEITDETKDATCLSLLHTLSEDYETTEDGRFLQSNSIKGIKAKAIEISVDTENVDCSLFLNTLMEDYEISDDDGCSHITFVENIATKEAKIIEETKNDEGFPFLNISSEDYKIAEDGGFLQSSSSIEGIQIKANKITADTENVKCYFYDYETAGDDGFLQSSFTKVTETEAAEIFEETENSECLLQLNSFRKIYDKNTKLRYFYEISDDDARSKTTTMKYNSTKVINMNESTDTAKNFLYLNNSNEDYEISEGIVCLQSSEIGNFKTKVVEIPVVVRNYLNISSAHATSLLQGNEIIPKKYCKGTSQEVINSSEYINTDNPKNQTVPNGREIIKSTKENTCNNIETSQKVVAYLEISTCKASAEQTNCLDYKPIASKNTGPSHDKKDAVSALSEISDTANDVQTKEKIKLRRFSQCWAEIRRIPARMNKFFCCSLSSSSK